MSNFQAIKTVLSRNAESVNADGKPVARPVANELTLKLTCEAQETHSPIFRIEAPSVYEP